VLGYGLFVALWGAGYRRERLETRLGLDGAGVVPQHPQDIARWVAALSRLITRDIPQASLRDGARALESLHASLSRTIQAWDGTAPVLPRRVKRLPAGSLLAFGSAGITVPFFLEPHVDGGETEVSFLAVAVHELAHVAGYCAEADADLAAAFAGLRADDPYARYAVALWLFQDFAGLLPSRDDMTAADASLPELAREDIREARRATARYRIPALARVQGKVYDAYLRSQGLKEGVREYSFIVRMLVAAERKGLIRIAGEGEPPAGPSSER
jgi:hypothetical protein